jgi:hypothetical protein
MTKTRRLHLRLEEEVVTKLQKMADRGFNKNLTAALEAILDFYFGFDPHFMVALHETEARLGRSQPEIIEAIVLRSLATEEAHLQVFGEVSPRCFTEFVPRGGQVLRGSELFNTLKDEAVQIFEAMKEKQEAGELPAQAETKSMLLEAVAH